MYKPFLFLLLSCFISSSINAQYTLNEFQEKDKELIYFNDFSQQDSNWFYFDKGSNTREAITDKGHFIYQPLDEDDVTAHSYDLYWDYNRDYEIEIKAKLENTRRFRKQYGVLYWGRVDSNITGQYLYFGNKIRYSMMYSQLPAKDSVWGAGTFSKFLDKGDYNIYTIRKIRDVYYVFINGRFDDFFPVFPIRGGMIGLGGSSDIQTWFDYIKISYLNNSTVNDTREYPVYRHYADYLKSILSGTKYTIEDRARCIQGKFLVKVHVTSQGRVDSVVALGTHSVLNKEAEKSFWKTDGQWLPAIDSNGAHSAWVLKPIDFHINSKFCRSDSSQLYYEEGIRQYDLNNSTLAIELFKKAFQTDYTNIKAVYNLAMVYVNENRYNEACSQFNLLIDMKTIDEVNRNSSLMAIYKHLDIYNMKNIYCK